MVCMGISVISMGTQLLNQVWATDTAQTLFDATTLLGFVPEEILALR